MSEEQLLQEQRSVRAQRQRADGVEYMLRVIENSGGLLELVEVPQRSRHWFVEWARVMRFTGWSG